MLNSSVPRTVFFRVINSTLDHAESIHVSGLHPNGWGYRVKCLLDLGVEWWADFVEFCIAGVWSGGHYGLHKWHAS